MQALIGEVLDPMPCAPGRSTRVDDEYVKNGVVGIFMGVAPLAGKRHVEVTKHRTRKDWAFQTKKMLDEHHLEVTNVPLVTDNLNTHNIASLYENI